jgi:hypothetical protein
VIVNGFQKSCIFNAMDKTNDDTLWNDSDNNGNVRSVCVEDKGIAYEDGDTDTD